MKVCFFIETLLIGGIGRVATTIVNNLAGYRGCSVCVALYARDGENEVYKIDPSITIETLLEKHTSMKDAIIKGRIVSKLHRYLKTNDIDIIIACGDLMFPAAVLACIGIKTKVVAWDHIAPTAKAQYGLQEVCRSVGAHFSNTVLVLTKAAQQYYQTKYPRQRIIQIYNPIDPLIFNNICQYNAESTRIISVGRLCYQKNFSRLIDIAEKALEDKSEWEWDIYGTGEELAELQKKCELKRLSEKVHFKGLASNLYELYGEYSFIVMTSRFEGFPMSLLEASANGLPMVAFDVPTGPDEIITNGKNGFICDSNDDNEMIERIRDLIERKEFRIAMSSASHENSIEYRIDRIIEEWFAMLSNVVGCPK